MPQDQYLGSRIGRIAGFQPRITLAGERSSECLGTAQLLMEASAEVSFAAFLQKDRHLHSQMTSAAMSNTTQWLTSTGVCIVL